MKVNKNIDGVTAIKCQHRDLDHIKSEQLNKKVVTKCRRIAPNYHYFNGANHIALCDIHANEYIKLNLSVVKIK